MSQTDAVQLKNTYLTHQTTVLQIYVPSFINRVDTDQMASDADMRIYCFQTMDQLTGLKSDVAFKVQQTVHACMRRLVGHRINHSASRRIGGNRSTNVDQK